MITQLLMNILRQELEHHSHFTKHTLHHVIHTTHFKILHLSPFWWYVPDHTQYALNPDNLLLLLLIPVIKVPSAVTIMHFTFPYIDLIVSDFLRFKQMSVLRLEALPRKSLRWFSQETGVSKSYVSAATKMLLFWTTQIYSCAKNPEGNSVCVMGFVTGSVKLDKVVKSILC
jgi:hypothetical protein